MIIAYLLTNSLTNHRLLIQIIIDSRYECRLSYQELVDLNRNFSEDEVGGSNAHIGYNLYLTHF